MTTRRNQDPEFSAVWQVVYPDGSVYIAPDSASGSKGYIYSRSTADEIARERLSRSGSRGTVRQVMNADGSPKNGAR